MSRLHSNHIKPSSSPLNAEERQFAKRVEHINGLIAAGANVYVEVRDDDDDGEPISIPLTSVSLTREGFRVGYSSKPGETYNDQSIKVGRNTHFEVCI